MHSLLIVDDEENMLWSLDRALRDKDYAITCLSDPLDALDLCRDTKFDLILSDHRMPNMVGVELLENIAKIQPESKRILISAYTDFHDVMEAFNDGIIHKFISKPWDNDVLRKLIKEQLNQAESNTKKPKKPKPEKLGKNSPKPIFFHNILTANEELYKQIQFIKQVANSNAPFYIRGETGTGKELFARAIHEESNRKEQPFIAVNCANFSETLLESQLFGHKKGAFTGASNDQSGLFADAEKGTLFLDEVVEIPLNLQAKLLRVLQEKEYTPLGENKARPFDIQIISASALNLTDAVNQGKFRSDLRFRLEVMPIYLPPLRERKEDILLLVQHFIEQEMTRQNTIIEDVDSDVLEFLVNYDWPGNIRELFNICIYLTAIASAFEHKITMQSLPNTITASTAPPTAENETVSLIKGTNSQSISRELIESTLKKHNGNKSLAAKALGISRMTLYRKLQEQEK